GYYHPLYDLARHEWDVSGCEDVVEAGRLPRLGWSSEIAGTVHQAAAEASGIPAGTPVMVGTTDAPAEAVGCGVVAEGDLMAMYGSSGYFIRVGESVATHPDLWAAPFVFEGTSVLAAGTSTAGTATRWIAEELGIVADHDAATFARLMELASESEPGARGVVALPHFAGERTPFQDPASRGAFVGLGLDHTRADVARALLEGVGHSIAEAIATFGRAGASISRVTAVGGATRNEFIIGTVSSITGLDQHVTDSQGAAFGDAFLAALGVGAVADPSEAVRWSHERTTVSPDPATTDRLRADHSDYVALYRALAPWNQERTPSV
ncbi:MAG: FGGY-family carbohydrate kinase, partial [Propioniciclava sp.]